MSTLLRLVAWIYKYRLTLFFPLVVFPLVITLWHAQQPTLSKTTALLQVNPAVVTSPALKDMQHPTHIALLRAALRDPELLTDTARETGIVISGPSLDLHVLSNELLEINYTATTHQGMATLVDTLALNFMQSLLSPERFRTERKLQTLEEHLQNIRREQGRIKKTKPNPNTADALAMQRERLALQLEQGEADYALLLEQASALQPEQTTGTSAGAIWFAQPARTETVPYPAPLPTLIGYAILAGLALSFTLLLLRYALDTSLRTDEDVMQNLGLRILGHIPPLGRLGLHPGQAKVFSGDAALPITHFAEFTRLYNTVLTGFTGTLGLIGTQPGEGTTLIAYALALRSAEDNKPTLYVDLNNKNAGLSKQLGLTPMDWALPARKETASVQELAEELAPNLHILPAPTDVATLRWLSEGDQAEQFFKGLSKFYTHIVVDLTPLKVTNRQNADPLVVASGLDRTALILLAGITPKAQVQSALRELQNAGAKLVGVVVNNRLNPSVRLTLHRLITQIEGLAPGLATWLRYRLDAARV